jgi:23S rRNA (cytosine1962-C5)-methyltransferase
VTALRVTRNGAARWEGGHPWIFASDLLPGQTAEPGATVEVQDERGRFLGMAHYSAASQIALRLLTRRREPLDRDFWVRRLRQAVVYRERVVRDSTALRLVFSEADLLPGLIVDRYGDVLVLQTLTQGMDRAMVEIAECLTELLRPAALLARNDASVRQREGLPRETRVLAGQVPDAIPIRMNGLKFTVNLQRGQKTGAYLDQRENYLAAARHAHGKVLDGFSSTGGFALHVARQVESVEAIESSPLAIEMARANAEANGMTNIEFRQADVFDFLSGVRQARYDTIILDPPAFAKSRKQLPEARRGYKEINLRALKLLRPGGILITCSCSHHMSEAMLLEVLAETALDAGKTLRILERRAQAADHPVLLTVPETLYLKCLIFEVLE